NVSTLIDAWKVMTGRYAGSDYRSSGGVSSTWANMPLSFFNASFQERPANEAELREMLATMMRRAKESPHPSIIGLCDAWAPPDWLRIATEEGFAFVLYMTAMATNELLPPRRELPALEYRRVEDDAGARDLAMINAAAYAMPPETWECTCNMQ